MKKTHTNSKIKKIPVNENNKYFKILIISSSLILINDFSNIAYYKKLNDQLQTIENKVDEILNPPLPEWENGIPAMK